MLKGFRDFVLRGNVIDLAVAVVIGAAFTALVNSFTTNLIKPIVGLALGGGIDAGQVTVNGQVVGSGQKSQVIQMTNDPQSVQITVSVYGANNLLTAQNTYTIFLQRRPSERRTRVSAGFIEKIEVSENIATISADLVTLKYQDKTNFSTFTNETYYLYKYKTSPNCLFYYGTKQHPIRTGDAYAFAANYLNSGSNLYYLIYIEDQIVAVLPYASD